MDLCDLALDTKDFEWLNYIIRLLNTEDDFIYYFSSLAYLEGLNITQLVLAIKEDTEGQSKLEKELYIECNFEPKYKNDILTLVNSLTL